MVCTTLATPSSTRRSAGRRIETSASGRLIARPSSSAVTLTATWPPR